MRQVMEREENEYINIIKEQQEIMRTELLKIHKSYQKLMNYIYHIQQYLIFVDKEGKDNED